ncbi:MAG: D-2-hydroxyacid dehydrogenase [Opitutia bacterium]
MKARRIVVLDGHTLNPGDLDWTGLAELGPLEVHAWTAPAEVAARIAGADVVFTNKTPLKAETIAAARGLRFVGVLATGYNIVDVAAAAAAGVRVANVPGYGTAAVAQHVFALLLDLTNHAAFEGAAVAAGDWTRSRDFCFLRRPIADLEVRTRGVVGWGEIGRAVGRIGAAFGMKVLASAQTPKSDPSAEFVGVEELFARSDVDSLHGPLTDSTRGLVSAAMLARMKPSAYLINTARGPLIDEAALAAALRDGVIAGAGLDVVCVEPMRADCPLLGAPRCVITPHVAWASPDARRRLMRETVENLRAFLAGERRNAVA